MSATGLADAIVGLKKLYSNGQKIDLRMGKLIFDVESIKGMTKEKFRELMHSVPLTVTTANRLLKIYTQLIKPKLYTIDELAAVGWRKVYYALNELATTKDGDKVLKDLKTMSAPLVKNTYYKGEPGTAKGSVRMIKTSVYLTHKQHEEYLEKLLQNGAKKTSVGLSGRDAAFCKAMGLSRANP